jgi:CheY-like chemotaxis protein
MLLDYRTVYIVDDNKNSIFITKYQLTQLYDEVHVVEVLDPEEALETIAADVTEQKDLLFLDINMPNMSGWDFLEQIANLWSQEVLNKIDICILTTSTRDEDQKKAALHPLVSHYAEKPFDTEGMKSIMDTILDK